MEAGVQEQVAQLQEVYRTVSTFLVNYSFQIIGAVIVLVLGILVANRVGRGIEQLMLKNKIDVTLSRFTAKGAYVIVMAVVAIIALGKIGISVTPFVAAVGAISLGAGLALQGLLSNYGAGVSIIVTRPFVVGDTISVQGVTGLVKLVTLGNTVLTNEDNVEITIPNKHIVGEIIHNSFANSVVETTLTIAYSSDTALAIRLIREVLDSTPDVTKEPHPQVGIEDFGESGFVMGLRYWVRTELLFQTRYAVNARIRDAFDEHKIVLTYPQREIRLLQ
jgi:small conductance mechanosensitive channel